jgi:glucuronate isomerase
MVAGHLFSAGMIIVLTETPGMAKEEPLHLDEDRYFDPEPSVRRIARDLYEAVKDLPLVSPHGHVDPRVLAENEPFPDPAELLLLPDHYLMRMLYSQGIPLEALGIPPKGGEPQEKDRRKIWQAFGENYHLFAGTPSGAWLNAELHDLFGIRVKLDKGTASKIYDRIQECLKSPEYLPRALFDRFHIEVLATTDGAADSLEYHQKIRDDAWDGKVIPSFRPDAMLAITSPTWHDELRSLEAACGTKINSCGDFIAALENRRAFFRSKGAAATDQAVLSPLTQELPKDQAEKIFDRALQGKATDDDADLFLADMLMEMARMSVADGMAMQIHPGSFRNHNQPIFERFGPDRGCDIPVQTEYTQNLRDLLNRYGNDPRFRLIVFTLDESAYSRELAPLAGHYPAMKLGPPWWFHDSIEGMTRFRGSVTETAGIYNTAGFVDDTRAFPSIPARHDLSRRVDANFLARLVARHVIDLGDARVMGKAMAYDLVKAAYFGE